MAAALPIVTTPVGAAPEQLESDTAAVLTNPPNAQAVARAISRLLGDARLHGRLGRAVQAKALEFERERVPAGMTAVLSRALGASS